MQSHYHAEKGIRKRIRKKEKAAVLYKIDTPQTAVMGGSCVVYLPINSNSRISFFNNKQINFSSLSIQQFHLLCNIRHFNDCCGLVVNPLRSQTDILWQLSSPESSIIVKYHVYSFGVQWREQHLLVICQWSNVKTQSFSLSSKILITLIGVIQTDRSNIL